MTFERIYAIKCCDIFHTTDINPKDAKLGVQYKNYPAIVWKVFYKHRPWYKFWKKREIEGVSVLWLGDD